MSVKDIKVIRLSDDLDYPVFEDGDFQLFESDQQHIQDIVEAEQGWLKEFPLIGVGINQYIKSSGKEQEIQGKIDVQLKSDGYQNVTSDVTFDTSGTLTINTNAVRS